jgi:tetratricopeptide (TPR) repeat protein
VVSFDLRRANDGKSADQITQTHEFARDFDELVPSEEKITFTLLERVCDTFIPNVDVHFLLSPRTFLFDGSRLVSDGVAYAMRQDEVDLNAALQLWQDALKENPNSVAALYDSAVVLELRQQYSEAYEKYLQAEAASKTPNPFRREIAECKRSASVFADFISKKEEVKVQPQPPQEEKKPEPQKEAPKESPPPPPQEK